MPRPSGRSALRAGTLLPVTATVVGAAPAFAHVTTQPATAEQGGYPVVNMRVPNESDTVAPGTRIGPGEFLELPLSLGPLPTDTDLLMLPAVRTYDDSEVVAWDQPPAALGVGVGGGAVLRTRRAAGRDR